MVLTDPVSKKDVGIYCDLCGKPYRDKFKYYSAKLDLVEVDSELKKVGVLNVDRRCLDIDICVSCFDNMKSRMMKVIKNRESPGKGKDVWTAAT